MKTELIFEVSGINSQGEEVFPPEKTYPEFYENALSLVTQNNSDVLRALLAVQETPAEEFNADVLNFFLLPADRRTDESGAPLDSPGDLVLQHDSEILVNGIRLRIFFTIAPELYGIDKTSLLETLDQIPPANKPLN